MPKYWIKSNIDNAEFLESCGVVLGPRVGDYWNDCEIPDERDLLEHWGSGNGDTIMFGEEGEERRELNLSAEARERIICSLCSSTICADGTCSYPLCPSWSYEEEPAPERPKAARLRQ